MRISFPVAVLASLVVTGCARATRIESGGEVDLGTVPVDARALPSGTLIDARLNDQIGTKTSRVGDAFAATVEHAVVAQDGATVVPAGAIVQGHVTGLQSSTHAGQTAAIKIDFDHLRMHGQSYPLYAKVTATQLRTTGGDTRGETLKKAGVGAAAGAVLGAVLTGGDLDQVLLGGVLGAAAGTAISLGTGDVEAVLPAGTMLTLQATRTVALRQE